MSQADQLRITLRLPKALADYVQAQASKNVRSFNGEIVQRLERTRKEDGRKQPKKE